MYLAGLMREKSEKRTDFRMIRLVCRPCFLIVFKLAVSRDVLLCRIISISCPEQQFQ